MFSNDPKNDETTPQEPAKGQTDDSQEQPNQEQPTEQAQSEQVDVEEAALDVNAVTDASELVGEVSAETEQPEQSSENPQAFTMGQTDAYSPTGLEETVSVSRDSFPIKPPPSSTDTDPSPEEGKEGDEEHVAPEPAVVTPPAAEEVEVSVTEEAAEEDTGAIRRSLLGDPTQRSLKEPEQGAPERSSILRPSTETTNSANIPEITPETSAPTAETTQIVEETTTIELPDNTSTQVFSETLDETKVHDEAVVQDEKVKVKTRGGTHLTLEEEDILQGTIPLPTLPSRAGARWLSAIFTLLLTPVAWYLLADAAARLAFAPGNSMETGVPTILPLGEFVGGLIVVVLIALLAARSSLGLILSGIVVLVVGVPFLAVPAMVTDWFTYLDPVANYNAFGANVVHNLALTGYPGVLLLFGFLMITFGWVIAAVRRAGRKEERLRVEVLEKNEAGLKPRWARKITVTTED